MCLNNEKKKISLTWSMAGTLAIAWFVPLLVLAMVLVYSMNRRLEEQIDQTIMITAEKAIQLCEMQMESSIASSMVALYINVIDQAYTRYRLTKDEKELRIMTRFLEDHLYLYRNLINLDDTYGVLVLELDKDELFYGLERIWGMEDYAFVIEDKIAFNTGVRSEILFEVIFRGNKEKEYVAKEEMNYYYEIGTLGPYTLTYVIEASRNNMIEEMDHVSIIIIIAIAFIIVLILVILHFLNQQVRRPVKNLIDMAKEIKEGNYGIQIKKYSNTHEFAYLEESFNMMSVELKNQFEQIYVEELALQDANIMILESQINPHFLNNTLEIINWEARVQGNQKVSGMIESLSVMLNANMNRESKKFITLKEEIEYIEAYFYIIAERFGSRFEYTMNIDEECLNILIPRLIVQPIVENAVEHGMYPVKQGKLQLSVHGDEKVLYIEVRNNKALTQADKDKIRLYIGEFEDLDSSGPRRLGIRNVNKRLKMIYGEGSGLEIISSGQNETLSRITIEFQED